MSKKQLEFSNSVLLAPMAGVNDAIFRSICQRFGADFSYSEMVSAMGLSHQSAKSLELLTNADPTLPFAAQLFGKNPVVLAEQARMLEEQFHENLVLIDINMGCPTKKIAGKGEGAALMRDPALAEQILRAVVDAVTLPVTVKFRRGYFEGDETAPEFARMAEASGVAAVAVHGRWAVQLYRGKADRELIGRVRQAVSIPVIASGDVFSGEDALYYLNEQGADAVMVARGAMGNPWIFAAIKGAVAKTGAASLSTYVPTIGERVAVAREHTLRLFETQPGRLVTMRKHIAWYFSGVRGASVIRQKVNQCVNLNDYINLLGQIEAEA